ncbi:MAG: rhamnulokinase, partial [Clostridia bacterium]|nr:rhamnulokinase [Clostridia bacterium]
IPYSVGVDTWGVDYVLLDEKDKVLDCAFCYRDDRTEKRIPEVHELLSLQTLYSKTGIQFAPFNTIYQLYDDKKSEKLSQAKTFLMLPDYFHFRLTGVKKQEYTNATTTGMVNAKTHAWDKDILKALGYNVELFRELSNAGTVVGDFTEEIVRKVGYNAKVILPATHDTASAVIAAPLDGRTPYISSGTWSLLGVEQDEAITSDTARNANYSNEGGVCGTFRLQKNIMGLWMIQQVRRELNNEYDFATLAKMAEENPVSDNIDVNDGRFLAPLSMIDEIHSAVGRQLSVGQTAYCIYNNLAKSYAQSLDDLENITGEKYENLNIIGGGSKNRFLNNLTKLKTGRKVITGPAEGTAIGNLIMQMFGTGEISSVNEGREIVKRSFNIEEV